MSATSVRRLTDCGSTRSRRLGASFLTLLLALCISSIDLAAQSHASVGEWSVSGPYHHRNLTIYLFHGASVPLKRPIMTLEEGLQKGIVTVYETGEVNELAIENLSDSVDIYVQAGDIVKGGRQDRTIGVDMTLAPRSGAIPIASFCVERGRWTKRGEESDQVFSESSAMVTSNELRLAIRGAKNQSEVWEEVAVMRDKLSESIGGRADALEVAVAEPAGAIVMDGEVASLNVQSSRILNATILAEDIADGPIATSEVISDTIFVEEISQEPVMIVDLIDGAVVSQNVGQFNQSNLPANYRPEYDRRRILPFAEQGTDASYDESYEPTTTSLQLTIENQQVIDEVDEYMAALREIVAAHDDVVGYAFMIDGEMVNADIYGSRDLFAQLWPKLLRSAATEAVAEREAGDESGETIGSIETLRATLDDMAAAKDEAEEKVDDRTTITSRKSEENVLFETLDAENGNAAIHRNYMKLE